MSRTAVADRDWSPRQMMAATSLLFLGVPVVALSAVALDGNILAVIGPLAAIAAIWVVAVAPIRKTLIPLIFIALAIDRPGDAENLWQSPFAPIGGLLLENLNKTVPIDALKFSLLILLELFLLLVLVQRRLTRSTRAERRSLALSPPLTWALAASALTVGWLCAYGVATGGDPQMAKIQVQTFLGMLLMAYLLGSSMRGVEDYRLLGKFVVAAGCIKSALAVWVAHVLPPYVGSPPRLVEYMTNHGDSILFAASVAIVVANYFERPLRRNLYLLVGTLPILMAGMIANQRRLVWMELIAGFVLIIITNPRRRPVKMLLRAIAYASPVLLMYTAVGLRSTSRVFAPVHMFQSVGDAETNRSTLYRDGENYNLLYTFRRSPVLGTGFGHPFELAVALDDISKGFKEWKYLPHNSILGLWAFAGATGFTGLWIATVIGLLLAARSYPRSSLPDERAAVLACMAVLMAYIIHCWGDIGFSEVKGILLVGPALAVVGQLAQTTGAWSMPAGMRRA